MSNIQANTPAQAGSEATDDQPGPGHAAATAPVELTGEQQVAEQRILEFAVDRRPNGLLKIGGYAGTGKTTVLSRVVPQMVQLGLVPMVCTFTGMASSVLESKGLPSRTIHSTIYHYDPDSKQFTLRSPSDLHGDLFVIDEGSTVSQELWDDIQEFRRPVVVVGDPGQLPPVGKDPGLMSQCDVVLETIHRQAADNPIIQFAHHVREGGELFHGKMGTAVRCSPKSKFWDWLYWADQALCGFNRTRVRANAAIRENKFHYRNPLEEGERIVCLQNDRELGVYNGQQFTIDRIGRTIGPTLIQVDLRADDGTTMEKVKLFRGHFGLARKMDWEEMHAYRGTLIADYAYCLTVHKFQGSEAANVLVLDEQYESAWCPKRWRYTAITRAAEKLAFCC